MAAFTVDTKLFQELGELLVAKEATALVELVKNAYDADATTVTVHGSNLRDSSQGEIVVNDDGLGMTAEEFESGFLRIAGRTKTQSDRRSPVFGRRYTGEKGVGRLAAHKLARKVQVYSRKAGPSPRGASELPSAVKIIRASIDWDAIEALETLDQVARSGAVVLDRRVPKPERIVASGTTLTLAPLRRGWTKRMIDSFLREAVTLAPTPVLWDKLPEGVLVEPLLFDRMPVRDQLSCDPGFRIQFAGDLSVPDITEPDVADAASWIAEIDFDRSSGVLRVATSPTKSSLRKFPLSEGFKFRKRLKPGSGPSFRARILQRSSSAWGPSVRGVRVFMEGFRVPPYGDHGDDWLELDRDYSSRAKRKLVSLASINVADFPVGLEIEEIAIQSNAAYMGAVFLHRSTSPELEMLVNREGFLPGSGLDFIAEWVRVAIDLIVRLGYAARTPVKEVQREERQRQRQVAQRADVNEVPSALRVRESAQAAAQQMEIVRSSIASHDYEAAARAAKAAQPHFEDVSALSDEFGSEAVMWRVLASLGTELAAFVHEINALALEVATVVADLDEALPEVRSSAARAKIQRARKSSLALADRIRRNATYLVDSTSFKGRRRRSRLPLRERFEAVLPLFENRLAQKQITLINDIPPQLRTPPMFPAELAGIFTNLLSNAVKFAGDGGTIKAGAQINREAMTVRIENTGLPVDLSKAPRLFEAFQSTTERPDALLGQGMGMGLTITRAFVQEYGGTIAFLRPSASFSTAIQLEIPAR